MKFDRILENNTLWAVRYENKTDNILAELFEQWSDPEWLVEFFLGNRADLYSNFGITDISQAIYDTIEDNFKLQKYILEADSIKINLDEVFKPLENYRSSEMLLGKEKARIKNRKKHASWIRLYAIKLEQAHYVVTGGAIKLTRTMQERAHTLKELHKLEKVRNYLISEGIVDTEGFTELYNEQ